MLKETAIKRLFDKTPFPSSRDPNIRKEIRAWPLMDVFVVTSDLYQRKDKRFLPFDYMRGAMFMDRLLTAYQAERRLLSGQFLPEALEEFIDRVSQETDITKITQKAVTRFVHEQTPGLLERLHTEKKQIPFSFTHGMADMLALTEINNRMIHGF